jgi:hypothetical protein
MMTSSAFWCLFPKGEWIWWMIDSMVISWPSFYLGTLVLAMVCKNYVVVWWMVCAKWTFIYVRLSYGTLC